MRRITSVVLVCLSLVTLGSAASAAEPVRSQIYIFGNDLVNGTIRGPSVEMYKGRQAAKFERMLKLRKDMTPGIFAARKERTFK